MWPFKKKTKLHIGQTTKCVNCGKDINNESWVGTGHLKKGKDEIVSPRFCNDYCLRDMYLKYYNWVGMPWQPMYGLMKHEEPFFI